MNVVLVMFRSDGEHRSFSIVHDMTIIGRREDCDLRIPLTDVSRKHCRLVKEKGALRLEDLGSSNGTYCNGQRIQEVILSAGDQLRIGPVTFVVQIDGVPREDELAMMESSSHASAEVVEADELQEIDGGVVDASELEEVGGNAPKPRPAAPVSRRPEAPGDISIHTTAGAQPPPDETFDPMQLLQAEDSNIDFEFLITDEEIDTDRKKSE